MIHAIWAEDQNGLIGVDGHLPWRLPAELQHFKATTNHQVLLMGRKTFEGMNKRVLPGRVTLVLTHDESYPSNDPQVLIMHSRQEVLDWYGKQDKDLFVIGGAELFVLFEADLEGLYQTLVQGSFSGDTYFPADFAWQDFELKACSYHASDAKNAYAFSVKKYQRKDKMA